MRCDYCGVRFATDDLHYTKHRGLSVQRQKIKNKYTKRKKKARVCREHCGGNDKPWKKGRSRKNCLREVELAVLFFAVYSGQTSSGQQRKKKTKKT